MINRNLSRLSDDGLSKLIDEKIHAALSKERGDNYKDAIKTIDSICVDMWDGGSTMNNVSIASAQAIAHYFFRKGIEFERTGDCKMRFDSTNRNLV